MMNSSIGDCHSGGSCPNKAGNNWEGRGRESSRGEASWAGKGVALQRQAIVDGLKASVVSFSESVPGTSTRDVIDMVLMAQYLDTIKEIGSSCKNSTVFIPHGPGALRDVADQIRDGLLQEADTASSFKPNAWKIYRFIDCYVDHKNYCNGVSC